MVLEALHGNSLLILVILVFKTAFLKESMWKLLQAIDWWSNMWTYQTEQDLKLGV